MQNQIIKIGTDNLQGEKPSISAAKAYAVCGKLKRMMKAEAVVNYETKYLQLMNTAYYTFKDKVNHTLIFELGFTRAQSKKWINEQL